MVSPILPLYAESFGVSMALIGLVIAAYGLSQALFSVPTGRLTERFGNRPFLVSGPIIVGIFALAAGLATNFWQLVFFRLLQGVGALFLFTAGTITLANIATPDNRGRVMSQFQAGRLAGAALGPFVGGIAAQYFGLRAPFFLLAPLAVLAGLWALWRIPETGTTLARDPAAARRPAKEASLFSLKGVKPFLTDINFMLISLVLLVHHLTHSGSRSTLLPLLGVKQIGLSEAQIGVAYGVMMAIEFGAVFIGGRIADTLGRKLAIVPGILVVAVALTLFPHSTSYWFFLSTAVVFGLGFGTFGPVVSAYVADISPQKSYGTAFGLNRSIGDIGFLIGPVLLGWLGDKGGFNLPFYANAALMVLTALLFALLAKETMQRRGKPKAPSPSTIS